MHIEFVEVANFRKLLATRIDLSPSKTLFVGANNSGKTSAMLALRRFLTPRRCPFELHDFTLCHWPAIDAIGQSWIAARAADELVELHLGPWVGVLPTLDLWLHVEPGEMHHVRDLIPTLDWEGGRLGVRLRYEPDDLSELYKDFMRAVAEAAELQAAATADHAKRNENVEAHLHAQVQQVFIKKAYDVLRAHEDLGENPRLRTQLVVSTHSSHDEGNTKMFYCPYHAWSYDLEGKLVGLPAQQTSYVGHFDKKDWGLIKAAQVATFRGTVWATWDASAPPFETYLGDLRDDLALAFGPWDGGDGDVEVLGGTQKWILKSNWKIVAENCGGDTLHDVSHRSVDLARIGAHGGLGRRDPFGDLFLTYGPEGHGTLFERFDHKAPRNHYQASPATAEYFQEQWRKRVERLGEKAGAQMVLGNIFPSSGFHVREPRSFASIFPRGPHETEIWRVYFVDKKAPQEVKDYLRRYYMRYAGPGGMTEQDDMENWVYATEACEGTKSASLSFHYGAAIDQTHRDKLMPGNVSDQFHSEQNARQLYVRWNQFMSGCDWDQLKAGHN